METQLDDTGIFTNILTLRYNPKGERFLEKLDSTHFTRKNKISLDFIEEMLADELQRKTDSEKKISVALSRGVDSTLILALIRKYLPDFEVHGVSLHFEGSFEEAKFAAESARHFGIKHHIFYYKNYFEELPKAISIIGQPFWDIHWYYVAKNSGTICRCLASGDGGDELFAGYTFRYSKFLRLVDENSTPQDRVRAYLKCHERDWVPDQEDLFDKKAGFSWGDVRGLLLPYFEDDSLSLLEQVLLADYNGKMMYNFYPINRHVSDYFGLVSVSPIISERLSRYAAGLPVSLKYDADSNVGKLPLRSLLRRLGADFLVMKKKQGFSIDTGNIWRMYGGNICRDYLLDSRIVRDGWINGNWVNKYINRDDLGVRYVNKFFGLLAFEIWYRLFVTKEMSPDTKINT